MGARPAFRSLAGAVLVLAAPALLALAALGLAGAAPWPPLAAAAVFLLAGLALLLSRHVARVAAFRDYAATLLQGARGYATDPPRPGLELLIPGLHDAIMETARQRRRDRLEIDAIIASNQTVISSPP